jgi:hypothetical protein
MIDGPVGISIKIHLNPYLKVCLAAATVVRCYRKYSKKRQVGICALGPSFLFWPIVPPQGLLNFFITGERY